MATVNPSLFSWRHFEVTTPELRRFELVLEYLPDDEMIQALSARRGPGRNDYPVVAMWNALLAGVVFQHPSVASLLRELHRNPALLDRCGFDPIPVQGKPSRRVVADADGGVRAVLDAVATPRRVIPNECNFSRFLRNVLAIEEEQQLITRMVDRLREELTAALPDFGEHLGYDGKALPSHSTGRVGRRSGRTSDPDADWGKHETSGVSREGATWTRVKTWFGYGLHLIADSHYELPVAFRVTPASAAEAPVLDGMLDELFESAPTLRERCKDFSADRGLDSGELKRKLWDEHRVRPLIDTRELWREEKQAPDYDPSQVITRSLDPHRADTVVYTEKGEVSCVCPTSQERRPMAFQGFESDRDTLKYRCPAAAYGFDCQGQARCHQRGGVNPGPYGRIVRIDLKHHDRRIFVPTPWGSPSWRRGYNRRSALERINSRIDNDFGFEQHYVRGRTKMTVRIGLALAVMMAMALGHVREGRPESMRSLIEPVPIRASG